MTSFMLDGCNDVDPTQSRTRFFAHKDFPCTPKCESGLGQTPKKNPDPARAAQLNGKFDPV